MYVTKHDVTIRRSIYDVIHKDVYPYEVPILEEMYGVGNVIDVEDGKAYQQHAVDEHMEFGRLQQLYGRHATVNVSYAEYVFGRNGGSKILDEYGELPDGEELNSDIMKALDDVDYEAMSKDQLQIALDRRDVPWRATDNKSKLITLLRESDGATNTTESG